MKEISPRNHIDATVNVPGSKSLTQRALLIAALADGRSVLEGPLDSEDTRYTSAALGAMGIDVLKETDRWVVEGRGGLIETPAQDIFLGNNGTATRFLTSVACLGNGVFRITGDKRMEERPIEPLMLALRGWGASVKSIRGTGCPPLEIAAGGLAGGRTLLPEGKSSQYLSSLLLVAPYARQTARLEVAGEVLSKPYVAMTLEVMNAFGVKAEANASCNNFTVPKGVYHARTYMIEGDASGASYFFAAAAISRGRVTVRNMPYPSLQGDARFVDLLQKMGCSVEKSAAGTSVTGPEKLHGITVDMGDCPDVVPTLAVVAAMAEGRTTISNIAHLRIKECDRLHVMASELAKLGVKIEEREDALIIEGCGGEVGRLRGAVIETHNDHRIAMSFAVAGLVVKGIRIENEGCVAKSFPDFWERFAAL
jgi:3-phosphoshikimate 1-carboxyvinyltransferase